MDLWFLKCYLQDLVDYEIWQEYGNKKIVLMNDKSFPLYLSHKNIGLKMDAQICPQLG